MKLTTAKVERTLTQFDAEAIPDDHPVVPQLSRVFGEHTFFLDGNGLHIVEPAAANSGAADAGQVVKIASWKDADRTSLTAHDPQVTDVVVELGSADPDRQR